MERVKSTVPPEKLLVFDVKEGWEPLCHSASSTALLGCSKGTTSAKPPFWLPLILSFCSPFFFPVGPYFKTHYRRCVL